jgi:carboxyl-terminal processing protease
MTVTIAKYLTPLNHDIHHRGIVPNVPVKMTEAEAQKLRLEDLGTRKDSQYRTAETTLVKQLRTVGSVQKAYQPGKVNLPAALATP